MNKEKGKRVPSARLIAEAEAVSRVEEELVEDEAIKEAHRTWRLCDACDRMHNIPGPCDPPDDGIAPPHVYGRPCTCQPCENRKALRDQTWVVPVTGWWAIGSRSQPMALKAGEVFRLIQYEPEDV